MPAARISGMNSRLQYIAMQVHVAPHTLHVVTTCAAQQGMSESDKWCLHESSASCT